MVSATISGKSRKPNQTLGCWCPPCIFWPSASQVFSAYGSCPPKKSSTKVQIRQSSTYKWVRFCEAFCGSVCAKIPRPRHEWQMHILVNKAKLYVLNRLVLFCSQRSFIQSCLHIDLLFIVNEAWVTFINKPWDLEVKWSHTTVHAISWCWAGRTRLCSGG